MPSPSQLGQGSSCRASPWGVQLEMQSPDCVSGFVYLALQLPLPGCCLKCLWTFGAGHAGRHCRVPVEGAAWGCCCQPLQGAAAGCAVCALELGLLVPLQAPLQGAASGCCCFGVCLGPRNLSFRQFHTFNIDISCKMLRRLPPIYCSP